MYDATKNDSRVFTRARLGWAAVCLALGTVAPVWAAGDPVNGKTLYRAARGTDGSACSSCHGSTPASNTSKVWNGSNSPSTIQSAITAGTGGMDVFRNQFTTAELTDLASYIAAVTNPSPTAVSFGSSNVGTTSATQTVTVTNLGGIKLRLTGITSSSTEFQVVSGGTCTASTTTGSLLVESSNSCTINLAFTPSATGARSATLTIKGQATNNSGTVVTTPAVTDKVVTLSGTGQAVPTAQLGVSPGSLTFAQTIVGQQTATQTVTVSNSGNAAMTISAITLGGSHAGDFVKSGTCSTSSSVAAGSSCTVSVAFAPTATGTRTGSLTLTTNAANNAGTATVSLSGSASAAPVPVVALSTTSLTMDQTLQNTTSAAKTVTLSNTGTGALTITSIASSLPQFGVTSNCAPSLAAGASCTFSVTFTPTAVQSYSGTIDIVSNASTSPNQISVTGAGSATAVPVARVSPTSLSFASTKQGMTSASVSTTLTNNGPGALSISGLSTTGTHASDFAVDAGNSTCTNSTVLNVGDNCVIAVTFSPSASGARQATLHVTHDGTGDNNVSLSGTGLGVATTQISLNKSSLTLPYDATTQTFGTGQLVLTNTGDLVATISNVAANDAAVSLTFSSNGGADGLCTGNNFTLASGASCTVLVSTTAAVSTQVLVSVTGVGDLPVSVTASTNSSSNTSGSDNAGGGGCSIGRPDQPMDPIWLLMVGGAAGVLVWRRRTQGQR